MMIRDMFADDINRKINGVIKVDQAADDVIEQELNEYVITRELKKHFITFFNYYGDAFDQPTADMGVWISGFFGSGKSHFLKMLSYLLENKEVKGIRSVERFRKKFEDDPATFMLIDRATKGQTETILFNIDIEGFSNKDKTAVLRVFAKMFYNHLGFYGENLKVAMMERYIDQQGKTEEFRRVFEEKKGKSWMAPPLRNPAAAKRPPASRHSRSVPTPSAPLPYRPTMRTQRVRPREPAETTPQTAKKRPQGENYKFATKSPPTFVP